MFERTIVGGARSGVWQYIRETANNPSNGPIENVNSNLMGCYEMPGRRSAAVQAVAAGSRIGFTSNAAIGHPGPMLWYMARVPDGQNVNSWSPSGNVWFKIDQYGFRGGSGNPFEVDMTEVYTTIPANLRPGNYLLRGEHIGLHVNGAPQFYLSCAQLQVTGSGTATPTDLVAFPGAYSASHPGLMYNLYVGTHTSYPYPGPAVWGGSGGSNPPPPPPPATTITTSTTTRGGSTPTSPPSGNCAPMYGQCGGQGWNGPTCCSAGRCVASNDFYSQCVN
ncbi:glycosyl hydrolase family 61-domain-containing protein [Stachybotrys elegans]|uniref:lytic cellulose monooxygenase (C4-dehydrogenating) n=1 Tax=Stachybotrys elegans TaxID=80388 RepID=A0A8K0SL44_9HYPO|nr:glycosyl hydrolase family 61-domain-containing protein [Stachybotrys elegans]